MIRLKLLFTAILLTNTDVWAASLSVPSQAWYAYNEGGPFLAGKKRGQPGTRRADIHLLEAWAILDNADHVPIAIIDNDFAVDSPFLRPVLNLNKGIDRSGQTWNFRKTDVDTYGHGTMVAALIGAKPSSPNAYSGILRNVNLIPIVLAEGNAMPLNQAFQDSMDAGAKIINVSMSFGAVSSSDPKVESLRRVFTMLQALDILVVVSADDGGELMENNLQYPAQFSIEFDNVITVGASDRSDEKAPFSAYSPKSLDIFAPGDEILSLSPNGSLFMSSGCSEAAPLVTGVAALVRELNPSLTADKVKQVLMDSADKIPELKTYSQSGGRLNAARALKMARSF